MRKLKGTIIMVGECVRMSLANIRGSKVRSFLTVLGIMIGVTAVIALITTVNGVTGSISDSFLSMGAGTLTVTISGSDLKAGLSQADLAELTELTQVDGLTPTVTLSSRVSRGGREIELTGKEFALLQVFLENKTIVLTRDQLLEKVWGYEYMGETNVVDVYVRYLRGKMDDPFDKKLLCTVRGVGYVLRDDA